MPYSFGKCVLLIVEGLENLVSYLTISSLIQTGVFLSKLKVCQSVEPNITWLMSIKSRELYICLPIGIRMQTNGTKGSESPQVKKIELKKNYRMFNANMTKKRRANESPEPREKKLARDREYKRKQRKNESAECRKNK